MQLLLKSPAREVEILNEFYLRAFARLPNQREKTYWQKQFAAASPEAKQAVFEDWLWSLLTCREFTTNH